MDMTWEAGIVLAVSVSIVITNVLTLLVLFCTDLLSTTNRYFFASLTIADLLLGLLYTPFSFWAALVNTGCTVIASVTYRLILPLYCG
jgi:hypothetical protein